MFSQQMAVKFVFPPEVSLFLPLVSLFLMSIAVLVWRSRHPPSTIFSEFLAREWRKLFKPAARGNG
jgi:hypothetical protein